jgi:selenium-binding protein 1
MPILRPDPSFYPSPKLAMRAPPEELAYVAVMNPKYEGRSDGLGVVDVDPASPDFGLVVGQVDLPHADNELHHFGWNACSSHLCPWSPHAHVERRYLIVPGLRSSRVHIVDTKENPRQPELVKVIEAEEIAKRTGFRSPHTVHCGPDGVYLSALGSANGNGKVGADGPGGLFMLDHESFEIKEAWEANGGAQYFHYDFWWHLGYDKMITSEWGTPSMFLEGLNPELLLSGKYGNSLHLWDLRKRRHEKALQLGDQYQMVLELRPAHNPKKPFGFAGVVISTEDLSASVWLWYLDKTDDEWKVQKVIEIPAEPADADDLPPLLKGFGAVPPLVTDINLSVDDRLLYVACWGTGEMRQYDVSNPFKPELVGSVRIGGIVGRAPHPSRPEQALNGGPQMVEISRDGKRVYFTNSLYSTWDDQFYPDGIRSWIVKLDASHKGGIAFDETFFVEFDPELRAHQVRLQGGDASSDSFCFS